jgi:hypothetical protein
VIFAPELLFLTDHSNIAKVGCCLADPISSLRRWLARSRISQRTRHRADFIPIARFTADPMVVIVNQQQPYKTLNEFIIDAKARPHEIIFSSSGLYGAAHIPMALLAKAAGGLELCHLPTAGAGPALTALLGNNANIFVAPVSASLTYIKSGQVRPLATLGASRVWGLPDVPTLKELGYDIEYYVWVGLFAPKRVPETVVLPARRVEAGGSYGSVQEHARQRGIALGLSRSSGLHQILGRGRRGNRNGGAADWSSAKLKRLTMNAIGE